VNREARLRRAGADNDTAAALADLPAGQVDVIARALRASHQAGREHERQSKRQRREDARRYGHHREAIPGRNLRLVTKQAEGAATGDLFYLEGLAEIRRQTDALISRAVAGCRAHGLSDTEIGQALRTTRQAVGQTFGRKGRFTSDDRAGEQP
jgi:hypothetical protein